MCRSRARTGAGLLRRWAGAHSRRAAARRSTQRGGQANDHGGSPGEIALSVSREGPGHSTDGENASHSYRQRRARPVTGNAGSAYGDCGGPMNIQRTIRLGVASALMASMLVGLVACGRSRRARPGAITHGQHRSQPAAAAARKADHTRGANRRGQGLAAGDASPSPRTASRSMHSRVDCSIRAGSTSCPMATCWWPRQRRRRGPWRARASRARS